jgi:amidase
MTLATELWKLPASQIASLVALRKVSALEVAQSALARLDSTNSAVNAVVECRPDEVLDRARQVDEQIARSGAAGPLAGVPVGIKVNIDQAGYATTNGLKSQRDLIARSNSPVVDSLLAAGAVPLGRTNTPAFSYRWFTSNLLHGATRNPHDPALTPGGSSGGAAAGVAAGMFPLAHGTDIAGSIRYPAYACGVHGLRPSFGRVAAYNASAGAERVIGGQIMAVSGPIARTVDDLRLGLLAMSRADPRDPWWVPAPLVGADLPRRAAVCLRPEGLDTQPEVCKALLQSAECLRDAGWVVDEVDALPPLKDAAAITITLWLGDGFEAQLKAAQAEGDPGAIAALSGQVEIGRAIGIAEFASALQRRLGLVRAWQLYLERYPVVLLPVSAELPFPDNLDLQGPQNYARVWRSQLPMIALPALGLPGLTVTTGKEGRTPVGVQLVAGRFREDLCLAAGEAIEARTAGVQIAV